LGTIKRGSTFVYFTVPCLILFFPFLPPAAYFILRTLFHLIAP
jgi:hypothetical protein